MTKGATPREYWKEYVPDWTEESERLLKSFKKLVIEKVLMIFFSTLLLLARRKVLKPSRIVYIHKFDRKA